MISIAIGLSVVLLFVILFLLFRIGTLASIFRGSTERAVGTTKTSNRVNGTLMILFLVLGGAGFIWSFIAYWDEMNPPLASVHGEWTDSLFWTTMIIIGVVFVITQILLFWYSYQYQHKDDKRAYYYPHNNKLEIIWTMIPAVVMALLVFGGWKTWTNITSASPEESIVVEVMGKQFNWMVRYPGADGELGVAKTPLITAVNEFGIDFSDPNAQDDFMPREIHVPKGKPVLLKIRARDVIHSVYMPHFRLKMDAVPGMPTKFWFVPTKTTYEMRNETGNPEFNYELACAEVCGRGHFAMRFVVVVDEPEEYEAWLAEQVSFAEQNPDVVAGFSKKAPAQLVAESAAADKAEVKTEL
ncbi:cytochrome c oxidase subunit II [Pontibacter akesuensis]|uniref:Cytochrome c oxidase subunit 2 n=1 Tax=Pontibacter akesuensis TaxID=388950 RepID=A0A1I7J0N8_9BACT|nr:cytochrome c oxidase subunit II [Pontibacter akesuensis]GHA73170.1 cytochrome c oxidase subunit II [Pontibacter akesuensis]SFU78749.1 cytochrome c oxidase subunit 2 [Pontibacter akesuensis]